MKFLCAKGILSVLLIIVYGCVSTEQPKIKVGLGEAIITPPVGTPMRGYVRSDVSQGVHDELYARALVVEGEDSTSVAMITIAVANVGVRYMEK